MDGNQAGFFNVDLDLDALPQANQLRFKRLSPKRAKIEAFYVLFFDCLPLLISGTNVLVVADRDIRLILVSLLGVAALLLAALATYVHLVAKRRAFSIRHEDITLKSGIIYEKTSTIPLNRIQHVEVHRPFLDRRFGLASLLLYTAGASSVDMTIAGLEDEQAQSLQTLILDHISRQKYED